MNLGTVCKIMSAKFPRVRVGEASALIETSSLFNSTTAVEGERDSEYTPAVIAGGVTYTFMRF